MRNTTVTRSLGDVDPARSRHAGRRSAVAITDDLFVVGTADGRVLASDRDIVAADPGTTGSAVDPSASEHELDTRWQFEPTGRTPAVVAAIAYDGGVVVGERSDLGQIRCHDPETGTIRWRYDARDDVGPAQRDSRFFLPFVVDLVPAGDELYALARRYARDGEDRSFTSVVAAFDEDGERRWSFETDASAIALDVDPPTAGNGSSRRVAVAYNRCTGRHQHGLVVLDAATGSELSDWDPGTAGQRRVGDVSLVADGVVLTSHGDYRGYRIADDGTERWRVDLATPIDAGGETLYAYPNHVHATDDGVLFVTGNTYAECSRKTEGLHPDEHSAFGYDTDGTRRWTTDLGGFATDLGADGDTVVVPIAQHFRRRNADVHGLRTFDVADGPAGSNVHGRVATDGVVTAVDIDGGTDGELAIAAIEEPVVYHDDGTERGAYRLHHGSTLAGE